MSSVIRHLSFARRLAAGAMGLLCALAAPASAGVVDPPRRLKVCIISLNEPHEVDAFRASLDPARFEIVDVRSIALARAGKQNAPGSIGPQWLLKACTPDVKCDVMVYSAEFAGHFFGKQGPSLSVQEMEEASCQARCDGLFRQPLEVFLLACNTLATKDQDDRTPEQYLQVLLDHGFDRASAERVVELRYGPLGPSFREALRRVFAGVPRIYGFGSVAPRGQYTAPMLKRYFHDNGDYAGALLRNAKSTSRNRSLLASFKGTTLIQIEGLTPRESGAIDRKQICALYDESRSVGERLRIAYGLLTRPDPLSFVPTLEVFLSRHPRDRFTRVEGSIFAEIQSLDATREQVIKLVRELNVSALKLELAHFAVLVGWLEGPEFHTLAVESASQLLHQPLSAEVVDILCSITEHESLGADFDLDDIPPNLYGDAQGLRLVSCLAPADPRITPRILAGLRSSDPLTRQWAVHTLTERRPLNELLLVQLVPYLHDPAPEVASRVQWLFQAHAPLPENVTRTMELSEKLGTNGPAQAECPAGLETCASTPISSTPQTP